MEAKNVYTKRCPKETANIISRLLLGWTRDLFWKGAFQDLVLTDLYHPLRSHESERLSNRLNKCWEQELRNSEKQKQTMKEAGNGKANKGKGTPRLYRALVRAFWAEYCLPGALFFVYCTVLCILQPIFQSWIISYFKVDTVTKRISEKDALIYAGCLTLNVLTSVFVFHQAELLALQMGMKLRIACCSLVYKKILRLNEAALTQTTSGQVVNLLSNDVSRFDDLCYFLHFIWISPIAVLVVGVIIWQKVGICTVVGIGTLVLMTLPVYTIFVNMSRHLREAIAGLTDKRVQMMNELIAGIQVIKMYAWEKPFAAIVECIRAAEMQKIRFATYVRAVYLSFVVFTSRTVLFLTLLAFVLMGNSLRPDITFTLATYFEVLQFSFAFFFPQALILAGESMVSIRRLEHFLLLDEQQNERSSPPTQAHHNGFLKFKKKKKKKDAKQTVEVISMTNGCQNAVSNNVEESVGVSVILERASANWVPQQLPPTLCNVSMEVCSGELCALVGPVGSGKSSILHLILKELRLGSGRLKIQSKPIEDTQQNQQGYVVGIPNLRISYASQEAWLFSGTVRDNILFGQPYNRERYVAVTRACALTTDFQQLPHGDMSHVGDSGAALSGGQKARVNLARAVYRQADIYLLDDPLSAVDARVAKHLFEKCIQKYLGGKTRILVTHQLQFVKQADTIVVLDRGSVRMQGSYQQLSNSNKNFTEMIDDIQTTTEARKKSEIIDSSSKRPSTEKGLGRRSILARASVTSKASSVVSYDYEGNEGSPDSEAEIVAIGRIPGKVYKEYFRSGGNYFTLALLVFGFLVSQGITSGTDYWMSYWTNLETVRRTMANGSYELNRQYSYMFNDTFLSSMFPLDKYGLLTTDCAIYVYAFCILSGILAVVGRNVFFMAVCTTASRELHNSMFSNTLRSMMSFFHRNPAGRILNRFSKDVGAMDETLPRVMLEAVQIFLVISGVLVMVVIVNHWMLIPLAVLAVLFYYLRLLYLRTAQNIKRLESVAKSPVFSHINATLQGLMTIRASGSNITETLSKQFDHLQDVHTGAWHMAIVIPIAFGLLLDIIACLFIACICFSFILLDTGNTLGGNVGLALSQAWIIVGTLQHGVKQSSEMVAQMTSVERIQQYTKLPKEGEWHSDNPPPQNWPAEGRVSLRNVSLSYDKNEPPVLKNLNVTIEPGWKVGVVGRTGAGKSSLISALFRLFAEGLEGEIKIDGIDTSTLGLHELRSQIAIIPQQPFLFSESLRYNLDPFNSYDDMALWSSLRQVELNDLILDQMVAYSGNNLSIGQRQLICLARAILRNNRILMLDEATANIDSHTDALIQKTIRTRFADCTVITIAHRLHTVIDSDRIIIMDAGRIVEFGCPHELLRDKPKGVFSQMVDNTGVMMAQSLREQAEIACMKSTAQRSITLTRQSSNETDSTDIIAQSSL